MNRLRCLNTIVALVLVAGAGLLLSQQAWLELKARIGALLIDRAFARQIETGELRRPWGWADTYPVAQLEVPRLGVRRTVLSGASGSSLAFGPGHVDGTAAPGTPGNCALAGHRDSWFAFVEELEIGDSILLRTRSGLASYTVQRLAVADRNDGEWIEPTESSRLTLITCYPFGGLTGGRQRYVVVCAPASASFGSDVAQSA